MNVPVIFLGKNPRVWGWTIVSVTENIKAHYSVVIIELLQPQTYC